MYAPLLLIYQSYHHHHGSSRLLHPSPFLLAVIFCLLFQKSKEQRARCHGSPPVFHLLLPPSKDITIELPIYPIIPTCLPYLLISLSINPYLL